MTATAKYLDKPDDNALTAVTSKYVDTGTSKPVTPVNDPDAQSLLAAFNDAASKE